MGTAVGVGTGAGSEPQPAIRATVTAATRYSPTLRMGLWFWSGADIVSPSYDFLLRMDSTSDTPPKAMPLAPNTMPIIAIVAVGAVAIVVFIVRFLGLRLQAPDRGLQLTRGCDRIGEVYRRRHLHVIEVAASGPRIKRSVDRLTLYNAEESEPVVARRGRDQIGRVVTGIVVNGPQVHGLRDVRWNVGHLHLERILQSLRPRRVPARVERARPLLSVLPVRLRSPSSPAGLPRFARPRRQARAEIRPPACTRPFPCPRARTRRKRPSRPAPPLSESLSRSSSRPTSKEFALSAWPTVGSPRGPNHALRRLPLWPLALCFRKALMDSPRMVTNASRVARVMIPAIGLARFTS